MKQVQFFSSSLLFCVLLNVKVFMVNGDLISNACAKIVATDSSVQQDFCIQRLQYDQRTRDAKDIHALGDGTIQLIQDKAKDIKSTITTLSSAPDPKIKKALQDCSDSYDEAVGNVNNAHDSFSKNDNKAANINLAAVLDNVATCEDSFKDGGLEVHPRLAIQTSKFTGLVKMGIAMTNM